MGRTRIFISYSHTDSAELAYRLRTDLSRRYDVWLDETGLLSGSDWSKELDDALKSSDVVLAIISKAASASAFCRNPLALIKCHEIFLVDDEQHAIQASGGVGIDVEIVRRMRAKLSLWTRREGLPYSALKL